MVNLQAFPTDIFQLVIEQLIVTIGIQKLVLLRTVSQSFNAAILHTLCCPIVDIDDPATPGLAKRMPPALRGKIIAARSRSTATDKCSYLSVVARVNDALDAFFEGEDEKRRRDRHESIAGSVALLKSAHRYEPVFGILVLKESPSVDSVVEAQNLLSGAVIAGSLPIVELLLERHEGDKDGDTPGVNGHTPYFPNLLAIAAARGHVDIVRYLLRRGARVRAEFDFWLPQRSIMDLEQWKSGGMMDRAITLILEPPTALRAAVGEGHDEIVHLLLQPEHRLPVTSTEYLRTIVAATRAGRLDLVEALFEVIGKKVSDFQEFGAALLRAAVRHDQKHVVDKLLNDHGVTINSIPNYNVHTDWSALQIAASLGNIGMVRFLIGRGAAINLNPNQFSWRLPIEAAARSGQQEVVELLLEHGATPAAALVAAANGSQPRLLKYLMDRFPILIEDGAFTGKQALRHSFQAKNLTSISLLWKAGVDCQNGPSEVQRPTVLDATNYGRYGAWMARRLVSIGAAEPYNLVAADEESYPYVRDVLVSERTWEWVSKY
ncbi:hypothetical protein PG989_007021 [Apiospora arundinis]